MLGPHPRNSKWAEAYSAETEIYFQAGEDFISWSFGFLVPGMLRFGFRFIGPLWPVIRPIAVGRVADEVSWIGVHFA